jgi:hypothetical protein
MRIALVALVVLGLICLLWPSGLLPGQEKGKAAQEAKGLADPFVYPGAEKLTPASTPTGDGPGIFSAKYTTPDGWAKVVAWYRKQLGIQVGGEGISINPGNEPGIRESLVDDSRQPKGPAEVIGEPRPVSLAVLLKKTNALTVNAVVSRAKDENVTHIVVTVVDIKSP